MGDGADAMKALVTGGGGFLGSAIVRQLLSRGDQPVIYSRGEYAHLGAPVVRGDINDFETLRKAARDCDLIFHVAAKAGVWGKREDFERTNIDGTRTVLRVCREHGPKRLVFTSSPSVVFNGRDQENLDESAPYPDHYETDYPRTKAIAEREVLAANGKDGLATVSLRPHLIWGPGDNHLIPRLVARAKAGQLRRVGDGKNIVDTVYIDNAAMAHLLAADRLQLGSPIAGKAYFIAQGEPMPLWDLVNRILAAAKAPPVTRSVSGRLAYIAGWVLEGWHRIFCPDREPRMTRFVARELATSHWFNLTAARRDLGYTATVSVEEGLRRLAASFEKST